MAKKRLDHFIPTSFPLDDTTVRIRVRRFTNDELVTERRLDKESVQGGDDPTDQTAVARHDRTLANAKRMVAAYVVIEPDELEDGDGKPIVTGEQLLAILPGREDLAYGLAQLIFAENSLSEGRRRDFRLAVGSGLGWAAWIVGRSGDEPAPTASSAAPQGSSVSAGAPSPTPPSQDGSSGVAAPSTSGAAPSEA